MTTPVCDHCGTEIGVAPPEQNFVFIHTSTGLAACNPGKPSMAAYPKTMKAGR